MLLNEVQTYSLTHLANTPFSSSMSVDHCFAFMTEKGIDILELAPDPRSRSPSLGCRRYFIKTPSSWPTASLGIEPSDLLPHLDREDAFALISDTVLSPKLVRTTTPSSTPRAVQWSPRGVLRNQRCVLSVLTDMGGLAMHTVNGELADVSSLWAKHCQASWTKPSASDNVSQLLQQLRTRAEIVKITAMCWSERGEEFVTISKSGSVAIWKVESCDATSEEIKVSLAATFESGVRNVTVLNWVALTSESNMLVAGNHNGQVHWFNLPPVEFSSDSENCTTITADRHDIWGETDKIAPTHLSGRPWRGGLLLFAVKGAFLLAFYLDKQGNKRSFCHYRCSDISINGLTELSEDEFLIVTRSARMTKVTVTLNSEGALNFDTKPVDSYINVSHMGCYGINLTLNKVICLILLSVNQSYDHLRLREPSQVVICSVSGLTDPVKILQDPQKPVAQLWDCLDLLRVQILQKALVSEVTPQRAALDTMSIDQLTVTLWWTTFAAAAEEDDAKQHSLLSLREEVETLVVSCHFFKRIASLLSCPVNSLSPFQLQSLGLVTKWLRWLQTLPPEFATTLITAATLMQQLEALQQHFPGTELCAICGADVAMLSSSKLFMAKCKQSHWLPRCSLSLVQCSQLPYYVCSKCGALGHPQAVVDCGTSCYLCGGILRIDEDILPDT